MQGHNNTKNDSLTTVSHEDALIANRPLDVISANSVPTPAPMPFIPGQFIRLPDGSLRPLTQEEKDRPDIDWPYQEEFPYRMYRRTCRHCKGELWCRDLGRSITSYKGGLHHARFAVIACENGCKDPVKFTERELKGIEWYEANSQHVYYTPAEIREWKASINKRRKETAHVK